MAQPIIVQEGWSRMVRDVARDQLDGDSLWNMVDIIPQAGAPGRCRGPWAYATSALAGVTSVASVFAADFSSGSQLISIGNTNHLFNGATDKGLIPLIANAPAQMALFSDLLILPDGDAVNNGQQRAPAKYDGSAAPVALGGSPPITRYVDAYKGRLLLAEGIAPGRKVYFSAVGNPESWDTTNAWIQATYPLSGMVALRGAVLLFSQGKTERIRGDSPPPSLGMVLEPAFDVGCTDARSIAKFDDKVIFANSGGVYMTDGGGLQDLTLAGGMKSYWRDTLAAYSSSWIIAGGIYKRWYIVSINGGSVHETLVCDLDSKAWFRIGNINASMFARSLGAAEETYFGQGNAARVATLSGTFSPSLAVSRQDADGTNILPVLETGYLRPRPYSRATRYLPPGASKRAKNVYLSADIRGDTGQNPVLNVGYLLDPAAAAYTANGSFPSIDWQSVSAGLKRKRLSVSQQSQGFAFRLAAAGGTLRALDLYDLELEYRFREASRRT